MSDDYEKQREKARKRQAKKWRSLLVRAVARIEQQASVEMRANAGPDGYWSDGCYCPEPMSLAQAKEFVEMTAEDEGETWLLRQLAEKYLEITYGWNGVTINKELIERKETVPSLPSDYFVHPDSDSA